MFVVSNGIVALHDGKLAVFSEGEGMGSRFTLKLPATNAGYDLSVPARVDNSENRRLSYGVSVSDPRLFRHVPHPPNDPDEVKPTDRESATLLPFSKRSTQRTSADPSDINYVHIDGSGSSHSSPAHSVGHRNGSRESLLGNVSFRDFRVHDCDKIEQEGPLIFNRVQRREARIPYASLYSSSDHSSSKSVFDPLAQDKDVGYDLSRGVCQISSDQIEEKPLSTLEEEKVDEREKESSSNNGLEKGNESVNNSVISNENRAAPKLARYSGTGASPGANPKRSVQVSGLFRMLDGGRRNRPRAGSDSGVEKLFSTQGRQDGSGSSIRKSVRRSGLGMSSSSLSNFNNILDEDSARASPDSASSIRLLPSPTLSKSSDTLRDVYRDRADSNSATSLFHSGRVQPFSEVSSQAHELSMDHPYPRSPNSLKSISSILMNYGVGEEGDSQEGSAGKGSGSYYHHSLSAPSRTPVVAPFVTASPLKVLIADDSPMSRKMLKRVLASRFVCVEAEDGRDAVKQFCTSLQDSPSVPFDLVVLDFNMPHMCGPDVATEIRRLGYNGCIVGATGETADEETLRFLSSGANYVLTKPIDLRLLEEILKGNLPLPLPIYDFHSWLRCISRRLGSCGKVEAVSFTGSISTLKNCLLEK